MLRRYVSQVKHKSSPSSGGGGGSRGRGRPLNPPARSSARRMPPQLSDNDLDSDGPDEIPAKATPAKANPIDNVDEEEDDNDDDDDDEDGEEYRVEQILGHRFVGRSNTIEYEIKWLGYEKKADRTWEPIENLDNAMDMVNEYHDSIGGAPINEKSGAAGSKGKSGGAAKSNKRGASAMFDSPSANLTAKKRAKANGAEPKLPSGSWEEFVLRVHTVLEEETTNAPTGRGGKGQKELLGLIEWTDERKTQHPLHVLRRKCPQKLLDYYQEHLVFRHPTAKDNAQADAAASIEE